MMDLRKAGTFKLGDHLVNRMGYGAMQLAGPGVFGPPKDRDAAVAVDPPVLAIAVVVKRLDVDVFCCFRD